MKAKKALGQNFLVNENIQQQIVSLIDSNKDDLILEIGPGKGAITKYLNQKESNLLCIELDKDLDIYLNKYNVIYDDILNINLQDIKKTYVYNNLYVVGNLPYYITSPILEHIIKSKVFPLKMVFMVQKEVADRFSAHTKSKDYGYMTLFLNYYYNVQKEIFVPRNDFRPVPKVDSYVISLTRKDYLTLQDEEKYFNFLKRCFSQKRKTLKNNLGSKDFALLNLPDNIRAEELTQEEFIKIFQILENKN